MYYSVHKEDFLPQAYNVFYQHDIFSLSAWVARKFEKKKITMYDYDMNYF